MQAAVVVPVKAFGRAKLRLRDALDAPARAALARAMAGRVLAAAAPLPVTVVCDDDDVRRWAEERGATVCWTPALGLNGAVAAGVQAVAAAGAERVVVAHADLPFARTLAPVLDDDGVVLVPDRHRDGTNVLAVPGGCGFTFAYGPGSFARHRGEAERLGLAVTVRHDEALAWDIDRPDDLVHPGLVLPLR